MLRRSCPFLWREIGRYLWPGWAGSLHAHGGLREEFPMTHVLGIDVSKAKLDVALRRPDGKLRSKVVENSPSGFVTLAAWLDTHGVTQVHAYMEATGSYWEAVAEYLADAGHTVSVVNPAQIKAFGGAGLVRTKTDRLDARLIAAFCVAQYPPPWQAPPPAVRTLRALCRPPGCPGRHAHPGAQPAGGGRRHGPGRHRGPPGLSGAGPGRHRSGHRPADRRRSGAGQSAGTAQQHSRPG